LQRIEKKRFEGRFGPRLQPEENIMAEQTRQDRPATRERNLRGGTEGGEAARTVDVNLKDSGTPGITSPSGDVHIERPALAVPRTDMTAGDREGDLARLGGGKTPDMIRGYLEGLSFPARKDDIVRAVRRNGAPEDVIGAMNLLTATEYGTFEELIRDYPALPDRDDVEPRKAWGSPGAEPGRGSWR
jgi:hypothetical protein